MKNLGLLLAVGVGVFLLVKQSKAGPNETLISQWIEVIKASPEWMASMVAKADQNGITLDEQLRIDAIWIIEQGWQLP